MSSFDIVLIWGTITFICAVSVFLDKKTHPRNRKDHELANEIGRRKNEQDLEKKSWGIDGQD